MSRCQNFIAQSKLLCAKGDILHSRSHAGGCKVGVLCSALKIHLYFLMISKKAFFSQRTLLTVFENPAHRSTSIQAHLWRIETKVPTGPCFSKAYQDFHVTVVQKWYTCTLWSIFGAYLYLSWLCFSFINHRLTEFLKYDIQTNWMAN